MWTAISTIVSVLGSLAYRWFARRDENQKKFNDAYEQYQRRQARTAGDIAREHENLARLRLLKKDQEKKI